MTFHIVIEGDERPWDDARRAFHSLGGCRCGGDLSRCEALRADSRQAKGPGGTPALVGG